MLFECSLFFAAYSDILNLSTFYFCFIYFESYLNFNSINWCQTLENYHTNWLIIGNELSSLNSLMIISYEIFGEYLIIVIYYSPQ